MASSVDPLPLIKIVAEEAWCEGCGNCGGWCRGGAGGRGVVSGSVGGCGEVGGVVGSGKGWFGVSCGWLCSEARFSARASYCGNPNGSPIANSGFWLSYS